MQTQVLPATSNLALWREVSGERTKRRNREGIGRVIRQTRERRHMTVQTLARTLGQPVQAVANWESGVSRPEWEDVAKLSDALMHPVQAFLEVPWRRLEFPGGEGGARESLGGLHLALFLQVRACILSHSVVSDSV